MRGRGVVEGGCRGSSVWRRMVGASGEEGWVGLERYKWGFMAGLVSISASSISLSFLLVVMRNHRLADLHSHLRSFRLQWLPTLLTLTLPNRKEMARPDLMGFVFRTNPFPLACTSSQSPRPSGTRPLNGMSAIDHPSIHFYSRQESAYELLRLNHGVLFRCMLDLSVLRSPNTSSSPCSTVSATLYMTLNASAHPQYIILGRTKNHHADIALRPRLLPLILAPCYRSYAPAMSTLPLFYRNLIGCQIPNAEEREDTVTPRNCISTVRPIFKAS